MSYVMGEDERRSKEKNLTSLIEEAGLEIEAGRSAFLAFYKWESGREDAPDSDWIKCGYPGGVIAALSVYLHSTQ